MSDISNLERVESSEYDGTTDGLNLLIKRCGLNREEFHVSNWCLKDGITNEWTGNIMIMQFRGSEKHHLAGLMLQPGNHYMHKPDDTNE